MIALFDHLVCIKISGRANFSSSVDLKKVVAELMERKYTRFVLDLSDCVLMDSTFLGVLAGLGLKFSQQDSAKNGYCLELHNPNARISDLLENLGVAHLFKIITNGKPVAENFTPVQSEADKASRTEVTRTCLEAHKLLMSINPENVSKFKDVAQFLSEDLKKLEQQQ